MSELTELEKAYLAGFFDGDGNVSIVTSHKPPYGYYHQISVILTQSDKPFLDYWKDKIGYGSIYKTAGGKIIKSKKQGYAWRIPSRKGIEFLQIIYPYLIIKRHEAEIAFEFQNTIGDGSRLSDEIIASRELLRIKLSDAKKLNVNLEVA